MQYVVADLRLPELLARAVQGCRVDGAIVQEIDEEALTIAGNRGRGQRRLAVALLLEAAVMDRRLPELLSRLSIDAQDRLNFFLVVGRRQEHLIADNRRRAMP